MATASLSTLKNRLSYLITG